MHSNTDAMIGTNDHYTCLLCEHIGRVYAERHSDIRNILMRSAKMVDCCCVTDCHCLRRTLPETIWWHPCEKHRCRTTSVAFSRRLLSVMRSVPTSCAWFVVFLLLLFLSPAHAQDTLGVNSTTAPTQVEEFPKFNPHMCRTIFDTSSQIGYVCGRRHRDLFPVLLMAERIAKEECENRFKNEVWNCSGFSLLKQPNIARRAYKEAAYVHALSLAVIAHTVAKGCRQGVLQSCSCDSDDDLELPTEAGTTYQTGCSDNVDFGLTFAENFLKMRYGAIGLKEEIDLHNFRAGRHIIRDIIDNTPVKCKCHGISGACTFQTCYTELPDFSVIGDKLKQHYDAACQVESNGRTGEQFAWRSQCGRPIGNSDFIYETNLPSNLCTPDPYIGVLGVVGRVCDINSSGPNSCQNLCRRCNRGYTEHTERIQHQCNCHFHFCCEIRCTPCTKDIVYHTCT